MKAVGSSGTSSHFQKTTRRNSENNRFTKRTMTWGEKMRDRKAKKHTDCDILDQYRSALISHPLPPAILVKRPLQQINARYILSRNGIT